MKLEVLFPVAEQLELENSEDLREHFASTQWPDSGYLANAISDSEGRFWGPTGTSKDLSNPLDLQVVIGLRAAADGVLVSATTARAEMYQVSSRVPIAIVSRSGKFKGIPALRSAQETSTRVILLTRLRHLLLTRLRYGKSHVKVIPLLSFTAQFLAATTNSLGWKKVLVESGPRWTSYLARVGLVQKIQLTLVGLKPGTQVHEIASLAKPALTKLSASDFRLTSLATIDGTFFSTWEPASSGGGVATDED